MVKISNGEFLLALFGNDAPFAHVTDFAHDPLNIPPEQHLRAWRGDYANRYTFNDQTNQFFTISVFQPDSLGVARRRKALFLRTPVIVLDDVKEKLSLSEVSKLPSPSWILETSPGSEQWGYILDQPCAERHRVENLLDGLVANGLAPEGRDPGMKGVTRYVRLPDGYNNKASKLVNGQAFNCQLTVWQPFNTVTLEQLAAPFAVNLDAARRESRIDGAADVSDHPLLSVTDLIHIKEVRSDGRFDVTCPWVEEHTGSDDSGSAVFTNGDGTIGFKCHHGACQSRTGRDVLRLVEAAQPGFGAQFAHWKAIRAFAEVSTVSFLDSVTPEVSFLDTPVLAPSPAVAEGVPDSGGLADLLSALKLERPTSEEARQLSQNILKVVEELPQMEKLHWHEEVRDAMLWSKTDFKDILKDLRQQWYIHSVNAHDFYDHVVFVKELNQFYDWKVRIFFTPDAFQNSFMHEDAEAKKTALQDGRVTKVDRLDYAPKQPRTFKVRSVTYGNTWFDADDPVGYQGDVSRWLAHWDAMGWTEHRTHMLQWMAWTILHPDVKINHALLLGSGEGGGKDFLLYPLIMAMEEHCEVISGDELLSDFNDYLLSTKYLHVNETELGERSEAVAISNKLKPLAAAPPERLRVNQKGIKPIKVRNLVSTSLTTNSQLPLRVSGPSRRLYCAWSDLNPRDSDDDMKPEWLEYWEDRWNWMKRDGGADMCIHYLRNCVDLTMFNPAAAPPMTEFLREIREASKSPVQQTIERFIKEEIGMFKSDLLSAQDAATTIRAGELFAVDMLYCDRKLFTPTRVGTVLNEMSGVVKFRARSSAGERKIYAIRNVEQYRALDGFHVYHEYERQMAETKTAVPISIVK